MKRFIFSVAFAAVAAQFVFAGGVENKSNLSTGYIRNPSRNTECIRPEAAFYNIAGTSFMDDGFYVEAGDQFVFKKYTHSLMNNNYSDKTKVLLYPNADIVFKKGHAAIFTNFGIYAGGGNLNYNNGSIALGKTFITAAQALPSKNTPAYKVLLGAASNHKLRVSSITYGGEIGAAFNVGEKISLGAAFRTVYGTQAMRITSPYFVFMGNAGSKVSCRSDAWGFGGTFGVHFKPIQPLDISIQYDTLTKIQYEVKSVSGKLASTFGISKGMKYRADLPSMLRAGVGYQVTEPLYMSVSFEYYMNKFYAHQDSVLGETDYDNSWEIGMGADYRFNKAVSVSCGVDYAKQGINSESNNIFNPILDSALVGGGIEITPIDALTITGSAMYIKYFETDYSNLKLNKNVVMLALGVTYKLDF